MDLLSLPVKSQSFPIKMLPLLNSFLKTQNELPALLSIIPEYFVSITSVLFIIFFIIYFIAVSHNKALSFLKAENVLILLKNLSIRLPNILKTFNLS